MTDDTNVKSVIEALLFVSEKPVTLEQFKHVLEGYTTEQIRVFLDEMRSDFELVNRGLRIIEIAGGFQLITASALAPFLKKFYKDRKVERLTRQALETLAIIAYKQPVAKVEIEMLRNIANIDGVISSLIEKNLIRIAGRKNTPGRPFVFGTTKQFLEHFGLRSLEDLPKMEDFSKMAALKTEEIEQKTETLPVKENDESSEAAQTH
ncbi:MAG: SMC-Scp complex subunit ScpB [Candidatus Omnitrophica bacterium]|nr:SMC-Scp complex subunit ScpB [Candidatus Omnitrophota bacterium]